MVRLNCVSSALPPHAVGLEETSAFLGRHASDAVRARLERTLASSENRTRFAVMPLADLARLQGASERGELYRKHATALGERAVAGLVERDLVRGEEISAIVFASSTGWAAPSIDSHLVRRFGLNARCRRVPLAQLGCGGGVAALSLAAEIARGSGGRVLVVSVELPSLHLQLAEPSYFELVAAAQFGDGAAAALVSSDERGPEIVGTESVLLDETEQGGRILASETGFRLLASSGLPELMQAQMRELADRFARAHDVDLASLAFVLVHPRGPAVLDAAAAGLAIDREHMAGSWAAWRGTGNMVSASIYRAIAEQTRHAPPREGDLGMLVAFGTGVACEMALLRWRSAPEVVYC
jgi:alkylresorcinol/alkylpyrone synthase